MREFPVIAIRSVDFGIPDMARAEAFYSGVWGLTVWFDAWGCKAALVRPDHYVYCCMQDSQNVKHVWAGLRDAIGTESTASRLV